jgi:hypothetical protein
MKHCYLFIVLLCCSGNILAQTEAKLTAADAATEDQFGSPVSLHENTAVIGAPLDDDAAAGPDSGSAYVYIRDAGGTWTQQARLIASDTAFWDLFGKVSISGDTVVVGAQGDDDNGLSSGSAYVFTRDAGGTWSEQAKLTAADAATGDRFGSAVSVDGDIAVIGAHLDDDAGSSSGSAYVFTRDAGGTWSQQAKLVAADAADSAMFGYSVSLDGDIAIIGAQYDDDDGSVYVFTRDAGGTWSQQAKLTASDAAEGDRFGLAVSVHADTVVIGAPSDDGPATDSGSAYVFTCDAGGNWTQQAKLTASDGGAEDDHFGWSVAVYNDTAVIGAYQGDGAVTNSGSAYVFSRDAGGTWTQQVKLTASDAAADDQFGISASVYGDTAVIGANGDDDAGIDSGSAYVYTGAPIPVKLQSFTVE